MIRITNIDFFGVESQFQDLKIAFIKSAHIQIHYELSSQASAFTSKGFV